MPGPGPCELPGRDGPGTVSICGMSSENGVGGAAWDPRGLGATVRVGEGGAAAGGAINSGVMSSVLDGMPLGLPCLARVAVSALTPGTVTGAPHRTQKREPVVFG